MKLNDRQLESKWNLDKPGCLGKRVDKVCLHVD